jgi:hypothetical protein
MLKAVLDLNGKQFVSYSSIDLEHNWRNVTVIRIWLKARKFDLTIPIFVTRDNEKNTLTFFQTISSSGKTIVLVHPNPDILHNLHTSLKEAGHTVYAYTKVEDANLQLYVLSSGGTKIDKIIVPKFLRVFHSFTYKNYLNRNFPTYKVLTIDNKDYRDYIDMDLTKSEYINSIFNKHIKKENRHA